MVYYFFFLTVRFTAFFAAGFTFTFVFFFDDLEWLVIDYLLVFQIVGEIALFRHFLNHLIRLSLFPTALVELSFAGIEYLFAASAKQNDQVNA